jgi:hypothetical protein
MTLLWCSNEFLSLPTSLHSFSNCYVATWLCLDWTWTDNLTTNNETGAIFLHLLLLYVWKMTRAPYGWGQLQITVLLVTLIINKPPLIIHVLNNRHIHGWTKNDCTNTAETTVQLSHRFLAIVPPCTQGMAETCA